MTNAEYVRSLSDEDLKILLALLCQMSSCGEVCPAIARCPEKETPAKRPNWLRKLFRKGR